jgi:hypothetical protein
VVVVVLIGYQFFGSIFVHTPPLAAAQYVVILLPLGILASNSISISLNEYCGLRTLLYNDANLELVAE